MIARGDTWKPADGPLMTRWAKDVSPQMVHTEYPRPQMVREQWLNLNGVWDLTIDDSKTVEKCLVPFPPESALSGVMKGGTKFVYKRIFEVPQDWNGQRVLLHFGAVDWDTTVEVNGTKFGPHKGGYDAFTYDITGALKKTDDEQELIVTAIDPTDNGEQPRGKQILNPHGIWYTPTSGIWQTVWIEPVAENFIESFKFDTNIDTGELKVHTNWGGESDKPPTIDVVVFDGAEEVARGSKVGEDVVLKVANPKLWTPDSPHLYDVRLALRRGDKALDTVQSYVGFRKIEVKSDGKFNRLFLNGKELFQVGMLDQGFWPDGLYTAPTDEALKYDIEMTKKLGFNLIRKHVKVEPQRWYYWADKLGVVVWQDMPSANNGLWPQSRPAPSADVISGSLKQYEHELTQLIEQHINSPAVIMWVVFNEGWGQYDTERVTKLAKDLDPTRLVNNASGWTDFHVGDVNDMHKYPGPGVPAPEAKRAAVLGEFGGLGLFVKDHMWTKDHFSYAGMEDARELTDNYKRLLGRVWQLHNDEGLAAVVYTQTTDVEKEANGLMTYDREVVKMPIDEVVAANQGKVPLVYSKEVVPTSREQAQTWHYTFEKPSDDWFAEKFDDASWKTGPGGFGTKGTPGAVVRTEWNSPEIWIRREFDLPTDAFKDLNLLFHHDEDCEVYINGQLAAKRRRNTTEYVEQPINEDARKAMRKGKNVIAIHCKQTVGGQYIDAGIVQLYTDPNHTARKGSE
jgi:hypothetical protein